MTWQSHDMGANGKLGAATLGLLRHIPSTPVAPHFNLGRLDDVFARDRFFFHGSHPSRQKRFDSFIAGRVRLRVEMAFPRHVADEGHALLWAENGTFSGRSLGLDSEVIRLPGSPPGPSDHAREH